MRISVITPAYNSGPELTEALESVWDQREFRTGQIDLELIVVDDGSDAIHQSLLDKLEDQFFGSLKIIRLPKNQGPAAARNAGIRLATGDWLGFVDSDDLWPKNKIASLRRLLDSEKWDIVSGKIRYISKNKAPLPDLPYEDDSNRLHHVHLGALLAKKSVFDQGILFDETLRFGEDTDWWIRAREQKFSIRLIEEETLLYQIHSQNMTVKNLDQGREMLHLIHLSLKRRRQNPEKTHAIEQLKTFKEPQIEVIVPVYNGARFIEQAINSILNQKYPVKKIWIINDGSTDATAEILDQLDQKHEKIQVLTQTNQGVSVALNYALMLIKEEWVAFLDADDLWKPDRILSQVNALEASPDCEVFFGQILEFEDFPKGESQQFAARPQIMDGFLRSTLLCKRHLFEEFGRFDETLSVGEFIDWFQKVRNAGKAYQVLPQVVAKRRIHGENMTAKIDRNEFLHLIRKQLAQKRRG